MNIKITASTEINGELYSTAIMLNAEHVTEDIVNMSFVGELGKGFRCMLLDVLRKKMVSDMKIEKGGEK